MANFKLNHPVKTLRADTLMIAGRFAPAGTGTPTIPDSGKNRGWSVARTDVGDFTITFADFDWLALESFVAYVRQSDGSTPTVVTGGDWDNSAGTMKLTIYEESAGTLAAADIGADADDEVNFIATFRTSSV